MAPMGHDGRSKKHSVVWSSARCLEGRKAIEKGKPETVARLDYGTTLHRAS